MADKFFCLDIEEKYVKIVDGKRAGDVIEVSSIGMTETPENYYSGEVEKNIENTANRIKQLVDSLQIPKKNVNVIIPDNLTYSQILSMPFLNEKELISAIKYQADQFIPMPIEDTNIDIEVVSEDEKNRKILIMIVAVPKKVIEKIQSTVELSGLIPESAENELSANARMMSVFYKTILTAFKIPAEKGAILINFGLNSTTMSFFDPITFTIRENRNFNVGYQLFLKEIQINTDTDRLKAEEILKNYNPNFASPAPIETITAPLLREMTGEIKRFITKNNPGSLFFTNNISFFPGMADLVAKEISIPVHIFDPFSLIKRTPLVESYKNIFPIFTSALGGNLR